MSEGNNSQETDNSPSFFTSEAEIISSEKPPVPEIVHNPIQKPPEIININPHSGEVIGFLSPTQVSMLNNTDRAQAEQDRLASEHAAAELRDYQEALQRRNLENTIFNQGEKRGLELSSLANTNEGRKKIEELLTVAIKVNKGILDSKEKIQNNILQIIDKGDFFGSVEIQRVLQNWDKRNDKLAYPEFVQQRNTYRDQVAKSLHDIKDIRQFLLSGAIKIDYSNFDNNTMYQTIENPTLQNLYNEGFRNAWASTKDRAQTPIEPSPWYLQASNVKPK